MLKAGELLGVILVYRLEMRPFTDSQIALLETFADQAVIAIENSRLFNETKEALERQTATADVLNVISRSPTDAAPVFEVIGERAENLCNAEISVVSVLDGDLIKVAGIRGITREGVEHVRAHFPMPLDRQTVTARTINSGTVVHIGDVLADSTYDNKGLAAQTGYRSCLGVPMHHKGQVVGAIFVARTEPGLFSENQIRLLQIFADQAVIAIQNVKMFQEVQARTRDLQESLQQQTATADVLKVISRSTFDLDAVLATLVQSARDLCNAPMGVIFLRHGDVYRISKQLGYPPEFEQYLVDNPVRANRGSGAGRAALTGQVAHIPDVLADPEYSLTELQHHGRYRVVLSVPLLREGEVVGVFSLSRTESVPFTPRQIELVHTFADQAVIAIENVKLFEEVQGKTRDLEESLQQQTATADVLKVISRSTFDLETVLNTLVETAARLCRADWATLFHQRGHMYHLVAAQGVSAEVKEFILAHPPTADRGTISGRVASERRAVHVPDVLQDPQFTYRKATKLSGARTMLGVPLQREDTLVGIFVLARGHVEPFTGKEIELVTTFADQAVIAIENARLFQELRDRQAELRVTFDNMGDGVVMFGADTRLVAWNRNFQTILDLPDAFLAQRPSYADYFRYLVDRGEYSADLEADLSRANEDPRQELRIERTRPDGRIIEARRTPVPDGGFVLIYADVTERKRAEEAIRTARDAAEKALRELQAAQTSLVHAQKMAALGQVTAGIAHEIKNPLNFVNNFAALSSELTDELSDVLKPVALPGEVREGVEELTGTLKDNLERVVQHGKRADSIVKNMLLHSREGSGEHRPADINALVDESLNLAYHGARAEKQGFNITLQRDLDPAAGTADVYPQEITRVLLNLISNGFYAATKRATRIADGFEPQLKALTRNLGEKIEIRIHDNGTGIPPDIQERIFNPFFTTKPAGEGTGLGLSMSHDIVVKQHGGTIDVVTEPGSFTEFIITLPRLMP
jgi:PAS domain S-box-containing protein